MSFSAILVCVQPFEKAAAKTALMEQTWAEVYFEEPDGRMIVLIEGDDPDQELERIKQLKAFPGVLSAEMVIHCLDEPEVQPLAAPSLDWLNGEDSQQNPSYYQRIKSQSNF